MVRLAFLQNIGPSELFIIFLVLVLLFGASRIPQVARSLGRSLNEFKKGVREGAKDEQDESREEEKKTDKA